MDAKPVVVLKPDQKPKPTGVKHSELYYTVPSCDGEVIARWSGVGCTKCPGWYCL